MFTVQYKPSQVQPILDKVAEEINAIGIPTHPYQLSLHNSVHTPRLICTPATAVVHLPTHLRGTQWLHKGSELGSIETLLRRVLVERGVDIIARNREVPPLERGSGQVLSRHQLVKGCSEYIVREITNAHYEADLSHDLSRDLINQSEPDVKWSYAVVKPAMDVNILQGMITALTLDYTKIDALHLHNTQEKIVEWTRGVL